ncbi:transmembrane and immunoglobulin domain-containing protein 1 isoform X2 [Notamacropus eugenii]|uniref:transmembrane and immunoglobulin domain-containing protein 1 isoform X1 n=1 Tax=Notamacropus eugenii TaxID=9315 RepID=UPI003B66E47D
MTWTKNRLTQGYGSLLLLISLLPYGLMNVILTVNNCTQNCILQTTPGTSQSLKCAVQNHSQEEELLWFREDRRVDLKDENKINSSDICIYPVTEDDNGVTFTCKLKRNQSMSISVILNVTYEPILNGTDLRRVEEGSNIKIDCKVKSNPPAQMMWYRNDSLLNLEKDHHQIYQTSELLQLSISKVQKSDNGTYSCHANSPLKLEIKDFHLIVEDKKFTVPIEPIITATVVVVLTIGFGLIARRKAIMKLCIKDKKSQSDTSL